MPYSVGSKARLTEYDLPRFPTGSLFDRLARAVCRAGCLPRKELYETWEMARRVRRRFRGGRVVDYAAGHGLLAHVLLLLDDSSSHAVLVDTEFPLSAGRVHHAVLEAWPRLSGRISFERQSLATVALNEHDLIVSSHACGSLADLVLARATAASARLAVLPCCHHTQRNDAGALSGWIDTPLAIDIMRAVRLEALGYRVWTQSIPSEITPKNRLLLGERGHRSRAGGWELLRSAWQRERHQFARSPSGLRVAIAILLLVGRNNGAGQAAGHLC